MDKGSVWVRGCPGEGSKIDFKICIPQLKIRVLNILFLAVYFNLSGPQKGKHWLTKLIILQNLFKLILVKTLKMSKYALMFKPMGQLLDEPKKDWYLRLRPSLADLIFFQQQKMF